MKNVVPSGADRATLAVGFGRTQQNPPKAYQKPTFEPEQQTGSSCRRIDPTSGYALGLLMDKENQRLNMSFGDSAIDLRSTGAIPFSAAPCSDVCNDSAPALVERTASPMSSMVMSFSNQLQFGTSTSLARRSLDSVLARSQTASLLPSPFDDVELFEKHPDVEEPQVKSRPFSIKEKSRSCGDVGQLLLQDSLDFSSPNYESGSFTTFLSKHVSPSPQQPAKTLSQSTNSLAASTTLPADFELALPIIKGSHSDTNTISCETLCDLINGVHSDRYDKFYIIDCRYPYEFNGGHIKNAINLDSSDVVNRFVTGFPSKKLRQRTVIVFHCEFSKERGPSAYRSLRSADRIINAGNYPELCYPDIYLLAGGYKAFYDQCKEYCTPCGYVPMKHAAYKEECIAHKRHQSQKASALRQRSTSFCGTLVRSRHQAQGRVPAHELTTIREGENVAVAHHSNEVMDLDDLKARSNSAPPCVLTELDERYVEGGSIMNARGRVSPYNRSPVGSPVESPLPSPHRLAPPTSSWEHEDNVVSPPSRPPSIIHLKRFRSTPNLFPPQ